MVRKVGKRGAPFRPSPQGCFLPPAFPARFESGNGGWLSPSCSRPRTAIPGLTTDQPGARVYQTPPLMGEVPFHEPPAAPAETDPLMNHHISLNESLSDLRGCAMTAQEALRSDLMSTDELTRLRAERTVLAGAMDTARAPALASITIRLLEVMQQIDRLQNESDNGPFPGRGPTYPF